jgi:hypothetical protein
VLGRVGLLVVVLAALGCGDRDGAAAGDGGTAGVVDAAGYEVWFTCEVRAGAGANCPDGEQCPRLPLGSGGCDGVPPCGSASACGDYYQSLPDGISPDAGYPRGCVVGMPYRAMNGTRYPGNQEFYWCESDGGYAPRWFHLM